MSSPFPVIFDRALTSNQSYSTLSFMERLQKKIWLTSFTIAKANIRFGIKVGLGAAILATPAFLSSTRGLYLHFRGEWALVS